MSLVFGWNNFHLKSYKPSEVGLSTELDEQLTIERRQKYFHLMFIPFFSLGQTWSVRKKGDSALYETPAQMLIFLEAQNLQHKTPWYTFALPILAVVGGVLFLFFQMISEIDRKEQARIHREKRVASTIQSINAPVTTTYFEMEDGERTVYLKVVDHDKESLRCLLSYKDPEYSEYEVLEAFIADSIFRDFDTVQVRKRDMLKTFNEADVYPFEGYQILNGAGKFKLNEIRTIPYPVFKTLGCEYRDGQFVALLVNLGERAKLKSFTKLSANIEPEVDFPVEVNSGDVILYKARYINGDPQLRAKIKFELQSKDSVEFDFSIYSTHISLKPATK
jgi:hypothetical protein